MTNQNDSGGGCLLFLIDWIVSIVRNKRIKKYNKQSRGLEEYENITTDVLFPISSYQENIIISGGGTNDRLRFSEQIIINSQNYNRPIIVLHIGNNGLESIVNSSNKGMIANKQSKIFDVFRSFTLQEICQIVFDTCKSKYEIKPPGRYILQIVYELLASKNIKPYFSNFASFPFHRIAEKINDHLVSGSINQTKADELNSLLMMGQSECAKIDSFFYDMKAQQAHIAVADANISGGNSVLSAIKNGNILCLDLYSSANTMLVEMIVNSLIIAMNRGYEFTLFLDDVSIAATDSLKNLLCQKSNHNNIICSKDLYSLLNAKDDLFSTILGEAEKTVILSHGSHISCEKWSKYIGEYDKIEVGYNSSGGFSQSSRWGYNTNYGQTENKKQEYKVKPQDINRLSPGEIIIYDNKTGSLIQVKVI